MVVCGYVFLLIKFIFTASYLENATYLQHISSSKGMIGMTIAIKGPNCVIWYKSIDNFPFIGGVTGMIISWFVSPLLSGIISSSIFIIVRNFILRKKYEDKYIYYGFPILVGITILLNTFFIVYKGAKCIGLHKTPLEIVLTVSFGMGLLLPLLQYSTKNYNYINDKFSDDKVYEIDIEENKIEQKK